MDMQSACNLDIAGAPRVRRRYLDMQKVECGHVNRVSSVDTFVQLDVAHVALAHVLIGLFIVFLHSLCNIIYNATHTAKRQDRFGVAPRGDVTSCDIISLISLYIAL